MTSPFRFRPPEPSADTDKDGEVADWEDNWLSNALAWSSVTFVPTWCQSEQDWASRFAKYLWTSCPCCMLFRGLAIGLALGLVLCLLLISLIIANGNL